MSQPILIHESDFDVPATETEGDPKSTDGFAVDGVQFGGNIASGWSVQLQGTVNTTDWVNIGAAQTGIAVLEAVNTPLLSVSWRHMRVEITGAGTGDVPTVHLAGHKRNYG